MYTGRFGNFLKVSVNDGDNITIRSDKRLDAGEHLVKNDAHAINIGAVVKWLTTQLFRGHIRRCANDIFGLGQILSF